jgi:glycosyltransferase involved in cell wall biosynthesis
MKKLTICIPAYNNEDTIEAAVKSAVGQDYRNKRVIVVDDCSTDQTRVLARNAGATVWRNRENLGIGRNIQRCFNSINTNFILFLCADDVFTDENVARDVVNIFHTHPKIGVIGRYFYQFMNGSEDPVMTIREKNILISSCCPSGMAFRKHFEVEGTDSIFIELPFIVAQYLRKGWEWTQMEYDTVAARLHAGGNTGTKESYYKQSPVKVWTDFLGKDFKYHLGLIQLKNRAPKMVWREIKNTIEINPSNLTDPMFWACAITATTVPGFVLRPASDFYRTHINSYFCKVIKRPEGTTK